MIPRVIHQIWIGDKQPPRKWLDTWGASYMGRILWREGDIDQFCLHNRDKYDYFYKKKDFAGATDIARVEILEQFGGVYLDADSVCINPFDNEDFMKTDFFSVLEYDRRVANGTIGCVVNHPIMQLYKQRIKEATVLEPACFTIGGTLLTSCIEEYGRDKVTLLPSYTFYPKWKHRGSIPGKIFSRQMWFSTKGLSSE
jgi:inositol phosphorylceramide mannosyltransferase catalytic subunit